MNLTEALAGFPSEMRVDMQNAYYYAEGLVDEMLERGDLPAPVALMAGLALNPGARDQFEDAIQRYPQVGAELPLAADEVVIGGGAHAAIYAAVRRKLGFPAPLVLEKEGRFGGVLAMSRRATFFLNSRNRPGPLGTPGSRDALNVIPEAPMQPADIGGSEYQANSDLGLVIRCTLALNAEVKQATVMGLYANGDSIVVSTDQGVVTAKRVVATVGLGPEKELFGVIPDGKVVLSYRQLMERFQNERFPLRGLGRVAVVGGGDSGRTAVEALAGLGPTTGASVASLDFVSRIDWYGIGPMDSTEWLRCNRTRYKRLAGLFPNGNNTNARVIGLPKAASLTPLYNAAQVNQATYDTVVVCVGYAGGRWRERLADGADDFENLEKLSAGEEGGMALGLTNPQRTLLALGVGAGIGFADDEDQRLKENKVALFRLAPRTAAAAALLPAPA